MTLTIPFDAADEREAIGCVVATHAGYLIAASLCKAEHFYTPRYGRLFAVCAGMGDVPTTWNDEERVTHAAMAADVDAAEVWRLVEDRSRYHDVHGEFARRVARAAYERQAMAAAAEVFNAIGAGESVEVALSHMLPFLGAAPWAA